MKKIISALLLAVFLLSGCASQNVQNDADFAPPEEQRLVIYTSHKREVYEPIIREFEQRTGIWIELETGGTTALLERIAQGGTDCDLMFGGGVDSLSAYADCFSPYLSENGGQVLPAYASPDGFYTPFSALPVVLIYNTRLVRTNPPTGWGSLTDSKWRGKIAFADPAVSGSSYTILCTMLQALTGDNASILTEFAENLDGKPLSGSGDVVRAVGEGRKYIGVTLEETALKGIAAGYDIEIVYPEEGTSALPDGAAIVSGCAHRENAELFIDFLLSSDVQTLLHDSLYRRSVCESGANAGTDELKLIDYDLEWASAEQTGLLSLWRDITGGAE